MPPIMYDIDGVTEKIYLHEGQTLRQISRSENLWYNAPSNRQDIQNDDTKHKR